jgi:hypothetical protein
LLLNKEFFECDIIVHEHIDFLFLLEVFRIVIASIISNLVKSLFIGVLGTIDDDLRENVIVFRFYFVLCIFNAYLVHHDADRLLAVNRRVIVDLNDRI